MTTNYTKQQSLRLTHLHFSMIRFIFFDLSAAYSLAKNEAILNNQFDIQLYLQLFDNIRSIYVLKDIPNAKITRKQIETMIFNLHNLHKTINGLEYLQSKELQEIIEANSYQLNKIISDCEAV